MWEISPIPYFNTKPGLIPLFVAIEFVALIYDEIISWKIVGSLHAARSSRKSYMTPTDCEEVFAVVFLAHFFGREAIKEAHQ